MISRSIKFFVVLLLLQVFLPVQIALADTGPKPQMHFQFKYESAEDHPTIVSGVMYECQQADCSDAAPLEQLGPQGFFCDSEGCRATAYGFAPYHKIEVEFSDEETRQSNVFQTTGFESAYTVTMRQNDLLVDAEFSPTGMFPPLFMIAIGCICALVGLSVVAVVVIFLVRRSKGK